MKIILKEAAKEHETRVLVTFIMYKVKELLFQLIETSISTLFKRSDPADFDDKNDVFSKIQTAIETYDVDPSKFDGIKKVTISIKPAKYINAHDFEMDDPENYDVSGSFEKKEMTVIIHISQDLLILDILNSKKYNKIALKVVSIPVLRKVITDTVYHEMIHVKQQQEKNLKGKTRKAKAAIPEKYGRFFNKLEKYIQGTSDYFLSENEVEAYAYQMYKKSKINKTTMSSVMLNDIVRIADRKISSMMNAARDGGQLIKVKTEIMRVMFLFTQKIIDIAKQKLPHAKIDQKDIDEIKRILIQ